MLQVLIFLYPRVKGDKPDKNLELVFGSTYKMLNNTDVTRMCILNGCLAMLDATDLITQYKPQYLFLTDVLGQELLNIAQRYP